MWMDRQTTDGQMMHLQEGPGLFWTQNDARRQWVSIWKVRVLVNRTIRVLKIAIPKFAAVAKCFQTSLCEFVLSKGVQIPRDSSKASVSVWNL